MTSTISNGRLGNQIIRNLAVSLIAKKNNLYVDYCSYDLIKSLGIDLFIGTNKYNNTIMLTDTNYFEILNVAVISNLNPNHNYFQTKDITNLLYKHLHTEETKLNIIDKNPFKDRYNANNDVFIHIRLTDVARFNPGVDYYMKAISKLSYTKLYISTDEKTHSIIQQIIQKYPDTIIIEYDEIKTFQFGSTCKNIILSHGSFSSIIGYLSFFSNIYYPMYESGKIWYGDSFSINGWNKLEV